jgi:hypothetical protein
MEKYGEGGKLECSPAPSDLNRNDIRTQKSSIMKIQQLTRGEIKHLYTQGRVFT